MIGIDGSVVQPPKRAAALESVGAAQSVAAHILGEPDEGQNHKPQHQHHDALLHRATGPFQKLGAAVAEGAAAAAGVAASTVDLPGSKERQEESAQDRAEVAQVTTVCEWLAHHLCPLFGRPCRTSLPLSPQPLTLKPLAFVLRPLATDCHPQ